MTHKLVGSSIESAGLLKPTGVGVGVGVGVAVFVCVGEGAPAVIRLAPYASPKTSPTMTRRATIPETVHHVDGRRQRFAFGRDAEKLIRLF
jgi:hypothetical protein